MPDTSKAYKKQGGAPTFRVEAIRIGSLVAASEIFSECDLSHGGLKVSLVPPADNNEPVPIAASPALLHSAGHLQL
jgi:hypothetical protein